MSKQKYQGFSYPREYDHNNEHYLITRLCEHHGFTGLFSDTITKDVWVIRIKDEYYDFAPLIPIDSDSESVNANWRDILRTIQTCNKAD